MSRRATIIAFTALGAVLGLLAGWALGGSGLGSVPHAVAQPSEPPRSSVAIAPGPGGMWVVNGDQLRVCMSGPLRAGYELFTPSCGEPVSLR